MALLVIGWVLFGFFNSKVHPNTIQSLGSGQSVVLVRDLNGHYGAEAVINGVKTNVMVDTGATYVSISQDFAQRLGINSQSAIRMETANGYSVAHFVRLASVKLGGITATNVGAIIAPNLEGDALLGMSFLHKMDVHLRDGTMTITNYAE